MQTESTQPYSDSQTAAKQYTLDGELADPLDDPERLHRLYVEEDMSLRDVGQELGYHPTTIRDQLLKYDIPLTESSGGAPPTHDGTPLFLTDGGYPAWCSAHRFVMVHRLIAVAHCGLDALNGREVHHINSIPFDNRPSNLEVVTPRQHQQIHAREDRPSEGRQNHRLSEFTRPDGQTTLDQFTEPPPQPDDDSPPGVKVV